MKCVGNFQFTCPLPNLKKNLLVIVEVFNSYGHMDRAVRMHLKADQHGSDFDFDIGAVSVLNMGFFHLRLWHYVAGSYCIS